jgi:hypothetical protein
MARGSAAKSERGSMTGTIGFLAFLVGMIICFVGGWVRDSAGLSLTLVILGIIVGLLNITSKEMLPFLVAAIALVVVGVGVTMSGATHGPFSPLGNIDSLAGLGRVLNCIVGYMAIFMIPAAIINAVRAVWKLAQPGD